MLECIVWLQNKTCFKPVLLKVASITQQQQHLPGSSLEVRNLGLCPSRPTPQVTSYIHSSLRSILLKPRTPLRCPCMPSYWITFKEHTPGIMFGTEITSSSKLKITLRTALTTEGKSHWKWFSDSWRRCFSVLFWLEVCSLIQLKIKMPMNPLHWYKPS